MTILNAWLSKAVAPLILLLLLSRVAEAASEPAIDNRLRGNVNAPVTMIEYSDFTCGYCLKFFKETWPKIRARYVETGKVRFLYKDYPRADQGPGVTAALAARCAGDQGMYWLMHDRLFSADGRLDADSYSQQAKAIGLNQSQFRQCLRDAPHVQAIFQDRQEANAWGFRGTPGFVLIRTTQQPTTKDPATALPRAFPFEAFAEEIEKLLSPAGEKQK